MLLAYRLVTLSQTLGKACSIIKRNAGVIAGIILSRVHMISSCHQVVLRALLFDIDHEGVKETRLYNQSAKYPRYLVTQPQASLTLSTWPAQIKHLRTKGNIYVQGRTQMWPCSL